MSRTEGVLDRDPVSPLMWTYRKVWLQSSGWADCTAGLLSSVKRRGPERTERGQTSALWRRLHQPASLKRNSANLNNNFLINSTTSSPLLTLQACPSSLSALWASVGFWMTRPPAFPEKSMATRLASDFDCTHTHTHRIKETAQMWDDATKRFPRLLCVASCLLISLCHLGVCFLPGCEGPTWIIGSYTEAASRTGRT